MSVIKELMPKNSLQVVMVMGIIAIISKDLLNDGTGPFTDSYLMDAIWIIMLAGIYLIYVKESVWKDVTMMTVQFQTMEREEDFAQLSKLVDDLRQQLLEVVRKNALSQQQEVKA